MNCPICKKIVPDTPPENGKSYFPFCSERCKLIDLGRWLGGRYQIPVEPDDDDEASKPRDTSVRRFKDDET